MTERKAIYLAGTSPGEAALALQLKAAGIEFVREYRFHPVRRWRFDFALAEYKLAVEVEGGTYARGRHTRGGGYAEDCIKYAEAVCLGWRVLRFTTDQVEDGTAMKYITWYVERMNNVKTSV